MKKKLLSFAIVLMLTIIGVTTAEAGRGHDQPEFKDVELTEQQTRELKIMYEDLFNQRKGIIEKYQEFGVLSKKDADKMKEHIDQFAEKLEADGYIPKWDKKKKTNNQE
ncbi:hypothetical protein J2T56_001986 [Natronobacillus azotifigens]|uniref:DUF2680 domain-containing protein n=1 Tax=Natronobacillus azotifigens TaxID=472978 RepID=A0A9J6REN2_9BACI|nr:DUF2680 domain-containing protein [Natronobacillus azotifigens]MCZ0703803.1 DUF2680 domain-containing protein [Natronobacillus azotifigens]